MGEGRAYRGYWHWVLARVWGKWAIIDTGVSPGAGLLTFLVEKDWERVIVHTREELARQPTERAELQNGGIRSNGGWVDSKKGKTLHVFLLLQNTEFWILSALATSYLFFNFTFIFYCYQMSEVCLCIRELAIWKYLNGIQIWYLGYLVMQPGRAPSAPCFVANVRNVCRINKKVLISNRQQKINSQNLNVILSFIFGYW